MIHALIFAAIFIMAQASSALWRRVIIPNAVCGDGLPYSVFIDEKQSSDQLVLEFMGGGACWSAATCWGPNLRTLLHPFPILPAYGVMTSPARVNPYKEATKVFFTYCTGDVFTGSHSKFYFPMIRVHHQGYANIEKTLAYLDQRKILDFKSYNEVYVGGSSAGAIGAITHAKNIEAYLSPTATKILMADSPGLHFGKTFWEKFSDEQMKDFKTAFGKVGVNLNLADGFVSPYMAPYFELLKNWKIGIIQATKDIIMSEAFGNISKEEHEALVTGAQGIGHIAAPYANVDVWTPDSGSHAFLLYQYGVKDDDQTTGIEFVHQVVNEARQGR